MADDVAVVHPSTGEVLDALDAQPPSALADALLALRERHSELRKMERALEDELRRRMATRGRALLVFGDFEVAVRAGRKSEWDADDLEATLRELLDQGTVQAGELTEVIRHPTVVSLSQAQRLVDRLSGDARAAVERCRRWVPSGSPKVEVARSVSLPAPEGEPHVHD